MDSSILFYGAIGLCSLLLFFYFNSGSNSREIQRQEKISGNEKTQLAHYKEISRKELEKNQKDFYVIVDNLIYNFENFSKKNLFEKKKDKT